MRTIRKQRMHSLRRYVPTILALTLTIGSFADAEELPGFSKTKPTIGPIIETEHGYMVPYSVKMPIGDATFEMVPIPGGRFLLGSPPAEQGRIDAEGPQVEVEVAPFWIGKHEVTWGEYREFMRMNNVFQSFENGGTRKVTADNDADAVTAPSDLHEPSFTFTNGEKPKLPAVTMTQQAAKQYTKWISKLSGPIYRLPTEVEWEYACRAGTKTAYSFGDDVKQLDEHAWHFDNSDETTHEVGLKKPNPWGLYDMHGNVSEWVLDQYTTDGYQRLAGNSTLAGEAVAWPTKLFPRVLRGGNWDNDPAQLRSAARLASNDTEWRDLDPNLPKSPWWFTNSGSLGVGFRLLRPLKSPNQEELRRVWEADIDSIRRDEKHRIEVEGRGARGIVDPALPAAIENLQKAAAGN